MKHKFAGLVVLGLLACGLVNASNPSASSTTDTALPTAFEQARRSGKPVEMPELGSETTRVMADPQGTLTAEIHAQPAFAKQGNTWVPINTNLVSTADGGVSPAAAAPLTFSGGGAAPLAQLRDKGGNSLTLRWAGELPKPRLEGDTAIYAEILPGVDLHMRATRAGFSETLVIKNAKAAASVKQLKFSLETKGLTVRPNGSIVDKGGTEVFASAPAFMWDSAAGAARVDRARQPQSGDKVAAVKTKWTAKALTITPDRAMLTSPKTVFPVYVDPPVEATRRVHWTMITEEYPSYGWWDTIWRGRVGAVSDGTPATPKYYRSYFQQDVAPVAGARIVNATFYIHSAWSSSCTARPIQLWESGTISPTTTWLTQPTLVRKVDEKTEAWGFSSQCGARTIPFNVTSLVQQAADAAKPDITMAVRSAETDPNNAGGTEIHNSGLIRTSQGDINDPYLSITYNNKPAAPRILTNDGKPCTGTGEVLNGGTIVADHPKLTARLDDVDGAKGQTVAAHFEWRYPNGAHLNGVTTESRAPGDFDTTVSETLRSGSYEWRVRGEDGSDDGPWSPWCAFTLDINPPATAPMVSADAFVVAPFTPVPVSFTAADPDVVKFQYTMPGQDPAEVAADQPGGSATVQVHATELGFQSIQVSSVDAAGWVGPIGTADFQVEGDSGEVGNWKLDGPDTAPSTLTGDVTWQPDGRDGGSAQFNGGHLSTDSTVVQTDSSYSVMAWVKLDDNNSPVDWFTALSQDGAYDSSFFLQYSGYTRRWEFGMGSDDTAGDPASATFLSSDALAQRGVWTHIAGVNDRENNELRLYVNGRLAGRMASTIVRSAVGPLVIGRGQGNGTNKWPWQGRIDEVRVYQKVVSEFEIKHVARPNANGPEGHWNFDEGTGIVAADSSAEHNDISLNRGTGVSWSDGKPGKALRFAGTSGAESFAYTPQSVLDTSKSFTVAAWVRPSNLDDYPTVLCQEASFYCGFSLGYSNHPGGIWSFGMAGKDEYEQPDWHQALAEHAQGSAQPDQWTHLAGVYDDQAHQLRLYVNGRLAGTTAHTSTWSAKGALILGRGKNNAWWVSYWKGDIDEVHAVQRALTEADISEWVKPAKFGPTAEFSLDYSRAVGTPENPVEIEHFSLDDLSENDHKLTIKGNVKGGLDGFSQGAAQFTGEQNAVLHTAGPVADTMKSFTAAAWVKLADAGEHRVAVGQDGRNNSGFSLGYHKEDNRFRFEMLKTDTPGAWWSTAMAHTPPVLNEWTHLIGSYDHARGEIKLYVNGQLQATVAHRSDWRAIGPVTIGRGRNGGWNLAWWKGGIDEVRILDHAITPDEIAGLSKLPPPPVSGPVRFENTYSRQCLTDHTAETSAGWVVQRDCRDLATGYSLEAYWDGTYRVYASHPKYGTGCMGVDGGATGTGGGAYKIQDGICQDGLGQRVRFEPVALPVAGYRIRFIHSNQCLGILGQSGEQNIYAVQTPCSAADKTQIWGLKSPTAELPPLGPPAKAPNPGQVVISPAHSNLCLGERTFSSGLANWWRMNNPLASNTLDLAGTRPGVNENVTWSLDAQRGVVGAFNGTSSVAKWDTSPVDTTKSFTYTMWVRLNDTTQERFLWTVAGSLGESALKLRYDKAGNRWHVEGATRASGATTNTWWHAYSAAGVPQSGVWQHLAVVVNSTANTAKLLVNGTSRATANVTTGFNNTATGMRIGDQYGSAWFNGHLSDVQAYARALSDAEVAGVYSSTDGTVYQGPCTGTTPVYTLSKPDRQSPYWKFGVKHPLFGAGCMGVYGASTAVGTKIRDVQCNVGDQTWFTLEAVSIPAPGYRIVSASSTAGNRLCLTVKDGVLTEWAQVVQALCDPTLKHQVFKLQLEDPADPPTTGVRKLRSALSGYCLSEKPPAASDVKVYQTFCANTNPVFTLERLGSDGNYLVKASDPSRGTACMGATGASDDDQAAISDIYPCGSGKHQQFIFEPTKEPAVGFRMIVMHSNKCVAVAGQAMTDWAAVVQEECNETKKSQIWLVDDPSKPTPTPTPTPTASPTTPPAASPASTPTPSSAPQPTVSANGPCETTGTSRGWGVYLSGGISGNSSSVTSVSASWNASGVDPDRGAASGSTSLSVSGSSFSGNIPPQSGWEFVGGSGVSWTVTVTLANGQSYPKSGYTGSCYASP